MDPVAGAGRAHLTAAGLILEAAAILLCPIAVGVGIGLLLRRVVRRRVGGVAGVLGCLLVPAATAAVLTVSVPVVGLWDGITAGLLCGAGVLCAAHRWYADRRDVLLTAGSVIVAFLLLEVGARLFLGTPPAYPTGEGPHLSLATVLRTSAPDATTFHVGAIPPLLERNAMQADLGGATMADRPPSAMLTKEIVCSIVYGSAYTGVIDVTGERAAVFPDRLEPRAGATRRVLHIGDSLVFGANVARDQTFTVHLEQLEPAVQHINGGLSGMAPDDYLVVLQRWVERQRVDLAVMYLFEGNDLNGLDAPHPCANWDPILTYDAGRASLRFPAVPRGARGLGLQWLVINSPLPYLVRVAIAGHSAAAAFLGSVLESWSTRVTWSDPQEELRHLEAILRTARDELRERQVPFVVVVFPQGGSLGEPEAMFRTEVFAMARRLGIPALDATTPLRAARARGDEPIQPDGSHLNEVGHRLIATWLHEQLPVAAGRAVE